MTGRRAPAYRVSLDGAGHVLVTYANGAVAEYAAVSFHVYRVDDHPESSGVMEPDGSPMIANRDLLAQIRGRLRTLRRDVEAWEWSAPTDPATSRAYNDACRARAEARARAIADDGGDAAAYARAHAADCARDVANDRALRDAARDSADPYAHLRPARGVATGGAS